MLKLYSPQGIQDVDEFVSSSEEIWRNVAVHHLLSNGSCAVNGCRQNESPNSWQEVSNLKWFLLAIIRLKVLVVSSESGEKYAQIKHAKTVQFSSEQMWASLWKDPLLWFAVFYKKPSFIWLRTFCENVTFIYPNITFNIDWVRSRKRLKL